MHINLSIYLSIYCLLLRKKCFLELSIMQLFITNVTYVFLCTRQLIGEHVTASLFTTSSSVLLLVIIKLSSEWFQFLLRSLILPVFPVRIFTFVSGS